MTPAQQSDRRRWWAVIGYEVLMLRWLNSISRIDPLLNPLLNNLITEGKVLHTRNLCDFCTTGILPSESGRERRPSMEENNIKPSDLFDEFDTALDQYTPLEALLVRLKDEYGTNADENSVRRAFNRRLAHPTQDREDHFEYGPFLSRVDPVLQDIIK
jgi:hypothetical protein